jgi:hypothetical protein
MPILEELSRLAEEARQMARGSCEHLKRIRAGLELARQDVERAKKVQDEAREVLERARRVRSAWPGEKTSGERDHRVAEADLPPR